METKGVRMTKNVTTESYRKLSNIISELDNVSIQLKRNEYSQADLDEQKADLSREAESLTDNRDKLIKQAEKIAKEAGLPFKYVEPENDEWDSSDEWNSSSQYC